MDRNSTEWRRARRPRRTSAGGARRQRAPEARRHDHHGSKRARDSGPGPRLHHHRAAERTATTLHTDAEWLHPGHATAGNHAVQSSAHGCSTFCRRHPDARGRGQRHYLHGHRRSEPKRRPGHAGRSRGHGRRRRHETPRRGRANGIHQPRQAHGADRCRGRRAGTRDGFFR